MKILMWEHFAPGGPIRVGGHHLADRLLRDGAEIAWCVGPVSPVNFIKSNAETRARLRLWRRGGERAADRMLFAYAPMTLAPYRPYPLFDSRWLHRQTLRATLPRLRSVLARHGFECLDLLWMTPGSPLLALLEELPHRCSVYRMSDDTPAFPDTPKSYAAIEAEAVRRVDLVVATARRLVDRARKIGARRVLHLPNACDPEPFLDPPGPEPGDLAAWPRPRAIYAGAIDTWFDAGLVEETARLLPDWTFVLLGPARTDLGRLRDLKNVAVLGSRDYGDLPAYLRSADAGIVPFKRTRLTHAIHPIKIYEYCAAGLPVVSARLDETAAMGAPVRMADGAPGFAEGLRLALQESAGERETRIDFARRNSWDARYGVLRGELRSLGLGDARVRPAAPAARVAAGSPT
jgi:glycosyltransferase involved in cell wall biosynthesis